MTTVKSTQVHDHEMRSDATIDLDFAGFRLMKKLSVDVFQLQMSARRHGGVKPS